MNFRFGMLALSAAIILTLTGCELKEPDEKEIFSLLQESLPQKDLVQLVSLKKQNCERISEAKNSIRCYVNAVLKTRTNQNEEWQTTTKDNLELQFGHFDENKWFILRRIKPADRNFPY